MIWTDCVCGSAVCRVEKSVHCVLTVGDERDENMRYPVAAKVPCVHGCHGQCKIYLGFGFN